MSACPGLGTGDTVLKGRTPSHCQMNQLDQQAAPFGKLPFKQHSEDWEVVGRSRVRSAIAEVTEGLRSVWRSLGRWGGPALRGCGRCRCLGQTSSSSPLGAVGPHAAFTPGGLDLRETGGLPLTFLERRARVGEQHRCCVVLGGDRGLTPPGASIGPQGSSRPVTLMATSCVGSRQPWKPLPRTCRGASGSPQASALSPQRGSPVVSRPRVKTLGVSANHSAFYFTNCLFCVGCSHFQLALLSPRLFLKMLCLTGLFLKSVIGNE